MDKINISILTAAILSSMVFLPETVSAEFTAINGPGIFASAVFASAIGEKGFVSSTEDLFNAIDLKLDVSHTIEQARPYRDNLKMI